MTVVRVVHFTDTYLPRRDGVITSLRTLVAAQRRAGCAALTVVPPHPDQPAEEGIHRLRGVPLGLADLRVSPRLLRAAAADGTLRRVAAHEPDLIHVHTPGPVGLLGVLAARRLGGAAHAGRVCVHPTTARAVAAAGTRTGTFNIRGRTGR